MAQLHSQKVVVVGDGPAGLLAALALNQRAVDVVLVGLQTSTSKDRLEFVNSNALAAFSELGILSLVEQALVPISGKSVNWDGEVVLIETNNTAAGVLVSRKILVRLLRQHCTEAGVEYLKVWAPIGSRHYKNGSLEIGEVGAEGVKQILSGFVVDATAKGVFSDQSRKRIGEPLFGIEAWLSTPSRATRYASLEANYTHWSWSAPNTYGSTYFSAFTSKNVLQQFSDINKFLEHSVGKSELASSCTSFRIIGISNSSNLASTEPCHGDFFLIGNSALSSDPLLSCGWYFSVMSAIQAAICIHTSIEYPRRRHLCKIFYNHSIECFKDYVFQEMIDSYALRTEIGPFWQERVRSIMEDSGLTTSQHLDDQACGEQFEIRELAVLENGFITPSSILISPGSSRSISNFAGIEVGRLRQFTTNGKISRSDLESRLEEIAPDRPWAELLQTLIC